MIKVRHKKTWVKPRRLGWRASWVVLPCAPRPPKLPKYWTPQSQRRHQAVDGKVMLIPLPAKSKGEDDAYPPSVESADYPPAHPEGADYPGKQRPGRAHPGRDKTVRPIAPERTLLTTDR